MQFAVILTALSVEYMAVRSHLKNLVKDIHPQGTVYERGTFVDGGQEWTVGIAEIGVGNATSAVEAEWAIVYFEPDIIFFVGIAGGIKDVKIGDVVAATKVYDYGPAKANEDGFSTRPALEQTSRVSVHRARVEAREENWIQRLTNNSSSRPHAFVAPIAAGEKVIASTDSELFQFLRDRYNDAIAVEMEGYGFLNAAFAYPNIKTMVIRGISDLIKDKNAADPIEGTEDERQERASYNASAFAFELLAKLLAQENSIEKSTPKSFKKQTQIIQDNRKLLRTLREKCCKKNRDKNSKTVLFTRQFLDLPTLYVPLQLSEKCKRDRFNKSDKPQKISIYKVIKDYKYIVIFGAPGTGKSTVLSHLSLKACEKDPSHSSILPPIKNNEHIDLESLPILIKLRQIDRKDSFDLESKIKRALEITETQVNAIAKSGKFLLLIDGLDEVNETIRTTVRTQIENFINSYPKNRIVLTCRSAVSFPTSDIFNCFEVADLDKQQQRQFIKNYFSTAIRNPECWLGRALSRNSNIDRQKLYQKIQYNHRLSELAQSPLLLSMMCVVYITTGILPENRSELYEEGVEIYLERWNKPRDSHPGETYQKLGSYEKKSLLSKLAYFKFLQESEYTQFSQREIVSLISEYKEITLDEGYEVLLGISSNHGLLEKTTSQQWEFSHLTFQEYFAAQWIIDNKKWDTLTNKVADPKWKEVIQLVSEFIPLTSDWFGQAKLHLDILITKNEKLQSLLKAINDKVLILMASRAQYPYKQVSTRAFYYDLYLNFSSIKEGGHYLHQNFHYELSHEMDEKMSDALLAEYEMDFVNDPVHDAMNLEKENERLYDFMQDEQDHSQYRKNKKRIESLYLEADVLYKEYRDISRELDIDLLYDSNILENLFDFLFRASTGNGDIVDLMKGLETFSSVGSFSREKFACTPLVTLSDGFKSKMSKFLDEQENVNCRSESEFWIKSLLSLIREERKIGYIYTLDKRERIQAEQYYKANVFLSKLMNSSAGLTATQKETLEEAMLLPLSESEKLGLEAQGD